ncbi:MAG: hypothetical protein WC733_00135 [Methylophilus sp.]|jgi:hypothetical protein
MSIKKGSLVEVKTFVIKGEIVEKKFNEETDTFQYKVEYKGEDGETHSRWYEEDQLKLTKG